MASADSSLTHPINGMEIKVKILNAYISTVNKHIDRINPRLHLETVDLEIGEEYINYWFGILLNYRANELSDAAGGQKCKYSTHLRCNEHGTMCKIKFNYQCPECFKCADIFGLILHTTSCGNKNFLYTQFGDRFSDVVREINVGKPGQFQEALEEIKKVAEASAEASAERLGGAIHRKARRYINYYTSSGLKQVNTYLGKKRPNNRGGRKTKRFKRSNRRKTNRRRR
jgi:hypothetical protein